MTESQTDSNNRLREIGEAAKNSEQDIAPLIKEALALAGNRLRQGEITALKNDLEGYDLQTCLDYYSKPPLEEHRDGGYMPQPGMVHRQRKGRLFVQTADGGEKSVAHEIGGRRRFFIGLSAQQLQQLAKQESELLQIELSDLTSHIGPQEGGRIMLELPRADVAQMASNCRRGLANLIETVTTPGRREAIDERYRRAQQT